MRKFLTLLGLGLLISSPVLAKNESIYTNLEAKDCQNKSNLDSNIAKYVCPGVGGYQVEFIEDNLRQTLNVLAPENTVFKLNFSGFHKDKSVIGNKLEWRVKQGVPHALIVHLDRISDDGERNLGSLLMVAKISPNESCVVAVIKPATNELEKARVEADKAMSKPCKAIKY